MYQQSGLIPEARFYSTIELRAPGVEPTDAEMQSFQQGSTAELLPEPEWMAEFKDDATIVRAIDESMQTFEGYLKDVSISSSTPDYVSEGPRTRLKKRKKGGSAGP